MQHRRECSETRTTKPTAGIRAAIAAAGAQTAEIGQKSNPTPTASQLETLSMPFSPPVPVNRVNDGIIISGTLKNITEYTAKTGSEMEVQVIYHLEVKRDV